MPRFLFKLALIVTLLLALISFAARALGSTQPLNPAVRGFTEGCEGKSQPCWYGIVPGVTKLPEGANLLRTSGYLRSYLPQYIQGVGLDCERIWVNRQIYQEWRWPHDDRVWGVHISGCESILAGSIIALLGKPDLVVPNDPLIELMYFPNIMVGISSSAPDWVSMNATVQFFVIDIPEQLPSPPPNVGYQWHGFTSRNYYREQEPNVRGN